LKVVCTAYTGPDHGPSWPRGLKATAGPRKNIYNIDLILVLLPSFLRCVTCVNNNCFCTTCSRTTFYTWTMVYYIQTLFTATVRCLAKFLENRSFSL